MDERLLSEFLAEAEDLIEALLGDIELLRARRNEGRVRRELVGRIFRHVHTLKGSAAAAELTAATELAHEFENLLEAVRLGRVVVDDAVLDAAAEAAQAIAQTLSAASRCETPSSHTTIVERLRRLAIPTESGGEVGADALRQLPEDMARSLSEYEEHRLREAVGEGANLYAVSVKFELATFDERFRSLSEVLSERGELVSTMPGMEAAEPDQISFRILYATEANEREVAARLENFGVSSLTTLFSRTSAETKRAEAEIESPSPPVPDENGSSQPQSIAPLSAVVRVELSELDEMVQTAHELLRDTTGALDLALSMNLARAERTEMEIRAARIRRRFVELEERLVEMRMVPIAQTLARAARAGATAARALGKEIEFETTGSEVRLDKSLADAASDPLLHLLRNALDHGIESEAERTRAGKAVRGRVHLEAFAEGSRVRLRVTDDGRGIDPERVRRAAVERGIIEADRVLTAQQSLRLIFRPGFSTAREVSEMSGRGVGLDVVERAVEQFGGELRVESEPGRGTTFEMILPTTLALVAALVVRSGNHRYCIDASHITEAGYVWPVDIERVGQSNVVRWRGGLLPLFSMRQLLAQQAGEEAVGERLHVVVSHIAGETEDVGDALQARRAAVVVDGWDGHHEVLVRGLGRHASRWRGISGATALSDGTVALMLDLPRLLESVT